MKWTDSLIPTLKEAPKDAEIASHKLMIRAGLIRQTASGIYSLLPLGFRAIKKFEAIVRDEMNKAGATECQLPTLTPAELWKKSGRWDAYGKELLRLSDRADREFCYGPTHEELITDLVAHTVKSYKQLPLNLYQIHSKVRDEIRPRFGLMRCREFTMKDAYSFHATAEDLDQTYQKMKAAYTAIFARCGLAAKPVEADSGSIGGSESVEFMITADTGEDEILEAAGLAVNKEAAATMPAPQSAENTAATHEAIDTPGVKSIAELSALLSIPESKLLKTLVMNLNSDGEQQIVMVVLRGDHELNEAKLLKETKATQCRPASKDEIFQVTGASAGSLGPVNLKQAIPIFIDHGIDRQESLIAGANKDGVHFKNIVLDRDCSAAQVLDLRLAKEGDLSVTGEPYRVTRGIEVGHIFKLGTRYSEKMKAEFLDENGKTQPYIMGCYGVGIGRTIAAAIEQNHDEKGIVWPLALAPYEVDIIIVNAKDKAHLDLGLALHNDLEEAGIDVIVDNRIESPGVKFKDAELIGFPLQVIIGKSYSNTGKIELVCRRSSEKKECSIEELQSAIQEWKENER